MAVRAYLSRLAAKGSPRSDLEDVCHWLMCQLTSRPGIAPWPHAPEQDWSVETATCCVANGSAEFRGHPLVTVSETLMAALLRCADAQARTARTE